MRKYIIEIEDDPFTRYECLPGEEALYRANGFKSLVFDQDGLDKLAMYEEPDESVAELRGAERAWEFCRFLREECDYGKVYGMGLTDIMDMSYQNARAKYEAWLEDESEKAGFAKKVFYEFINEGQNNASKYGFRLGETIKFTPDQIVDIMCKTGLLKKIGGKEE